MYRKAAPATRFPRLFSMPGQSGNPARRRCPVGFVFVPAAVRRFVPAGLRVAGNAGIDSGVLSDFNAGMDILRKVDSIRHLWLILIFLFSASCAKTAPPPVDAGPDADIVQACTTSADCDDGNPCTNDFCTSEHICENFPNLNPCDAANPCAAGGQCAEGVCRTHEICCGNGDDDDGDGLADCADVDCSSDPACESVCPEVGVPEPISLRPLPGEGPPALTETITADGFTDDYLYNASGGLKIGVRREWGGSIVFFGMADGNPGMNGTNAIDANDTGREVQLAFYDPDRIMQNCAWDASCAHRPSDCPASITYLGWNPVQGGNRCNNGSGVDGSFFTEDSLAVVSTPLQWNPDWDRPDCDSLGCSDPVAAWRRADVQIRINLRFVAYHVVEMDMQVVNLAGTDHALTLHEMPTVYTANGNRGPDLWRLFTSDGQEVAIDQPANDGFYYRDFTSPDGWVMFQDSTLTYGVGIYHENRLTQWQGWQNRSLPFNNVRARFSFGIPAWGEVRSRAYLMLGNEGTIRFNAQWLDASLPPFGVLDLPAEDDAVSGASLQVAGWVLDNKGVVSVQAVLDNREPVELSLGASRPDVCQVYPGYPDCPAVGYVGSLDLTGLSPCAHLLEITAMDTDGNRRVIARRRFFRMP